MFTERVQSRSQARESSRAKVLLAAEELFERQGFAETTIRQIAEHAGVSVGTVMSVADKDGLLVAVFDQRIARLQPPPAAPLTREDPVEEIVQMLAGFVNLFATHLESARAYTAILVGGRHSSAVFEGLAKALVERVGEILIRSGRDSTEAAAIARLVHRAYIGELFIWAGEGSPDPEPTVAELRRTVRYLVDGEVI